MLFVSCRKPSAVGIEILPPNQAFTTILNDTLHLSSWVAREDSLITSAQNNFVLGSMENGVFGKAYAGIFAQLRLGSAQIPAGSLTLDSVVLVVTFGAPTYGEPGATHNISVFRVIEDMQAGVDYYATRSFQYDPVEIGRRVNYLPVDTSTLRIPLDRSFGEMLLAESQTSSFSDNASFQQFLQGLYIAPDTTGGHSNSMMLVDLLSSESTLHLHYRDADNDTLQYSFIINGQCATQNYFVHNYSGSTAATALSDTAADDSETLIEGINGLRLFVRLPDLSSLGEIAINKAELVLTVLDDTTYFPPATIVPRVIDDSLGLQALSDAVLDLVDPYGIYVQGGGMLTETEGAVTYKRYRINLAKHMHLLNHGESEDSVIMLQVYPPTESPARVRIGGAANTDPNVRMKLNVYYTKLL